MARKHTQKQIRALDHAAEEIERARQTAAQSKQPRFDINTKNTAQFFFAVYGWVKELIFNEPKYMADSRKRDEWLAKAVTKEPYLLGVLQSVVSIDKSRGWTMVGGRNQVAKFTNILHNFSVAPDIYGWRPGASVTAQNYYQADLGGVVEIGRLQKNGVLAAMYTVDPKKCRLTGNMDAPLQYGNAGKDKGKWTSNDYFRVASFPNPAEEMNGLGFCAVSRCIELAKLLVSVFEHDREKLASKAPKGILTVNNITQDQWLKSLEESTAELKSLEREYYSGVQVLAGAGTAPIEVKLTSLSNLPEDFDHRAFTDMIIFGYALAFGYDPREFWPVSSGALGTATESESQHRKASSKGGLDFALSFQEKIQEELPETLDFEFEQRDVDGDISETTLRQASLNLVDQMYKSVNADGEILITQDEARQLLVEANLIHDDWTTQEEDIKVADTDDAGEAVERQRVRMAMDRFPDEDIVRYSFRDNKYRVIRCAGARKFQIRVAHPVKKKRSMADYEAIRNNYWAEVYDSIEGYLTSDRPVTAFRNKMLVAMSESFTDAVYDGYQESGGELPLDDDTQSWLGGRVAEERGFIVDLFSRLKQEWDGIDPIAEAFARADGYAATLDAVFSQAKMMGAKNATCEFVGDDGQESCPECQAMKGKRHTIKYILENDLKPYPGTTEYSCHGYHCEHYWVNLKTGEEYR